MRIAFIGASRLTMLTAKYLSEHGHEIVIIEEDRARIDSVSGQLDCSFLNGDGANPDLLRELAPEQTDILFCLTDDDKDNLVASLVARSLKFKRIITSIHDPQFEPICRELGLEHTIVPERTVSRYLADMVRGLDVIELSTMIRDDARMFSFTAGDADAVAVEALELPEGARVICYYRDNKFALADPDTKLRSGDEVVILTHTSNIEALRERWQPHQANKEA
jgi:trk system potassium uptake protein TrkA